MFPSGTFPQVAIDDPLMYPIYAKACELDIAVFCCAGVPGPRLKMAPQRVELIDQVMYDFPELTFVTRHGCEPWTDLAWKLMLKWPGLHYSTSAFAPKHYPKNIIDYANTRGADKIIYAGYFPMGLSLERIMTEMPNVAVQGRRVAEVPPRQRRPRPQARQLKGQQHDDAPPTTTRSSPPTAMPAAATSSTASTSTRSSSTTSTPGGESTRTRSRT